MVWPKGSPGCVDPTVARSGLSLSLTPTPSSGVFSLPLCASELGLSSHPTGHLPLQQILKGNADVAPGFL